MGCGWEVRSRILQIQSDCGKKKIPFHAIWGLCWYNFDSHMAHTHTTCMAVLAKTFPNSGLQTDLVDTKVAVGTRLSFTAPWMK